MKMLRIVLFLVVCALLALGTVVVAKGAQAARPSSPLYGVTLPDHYRHWQLVGVAQEAAPLNELRAVLGNELAIRAYRDRKLPFPDGTVLVKLAWKDVPSSEFAPASIPGQPTTVQVMVKDSRRYAASGGWGFGRFIDGQPADEAQHQTCLACHQSRVKDHDLVFTRWAP